jgi:hypothetical protein
MLKIWTWLSKNKRKMQLLEYLGREGTLKGVHIAISLFLLNIHYYLNPSPFEIDLVKNP